MTSHEKITVTGLDEDANATANRLLAKLGAKLPRNLLRSAYYDGKHAARQVSQSMPPIYNNLAVVLGWTAKAVDLLARRCNLDTFTWADGDLNSLGFSEVWDGNMLGSESSQGTTSSLIHSTSFVITAKGGPGEPDVVWQFCDATQATGDWNARTRELDSLIVIAGADDKGKVNAFDLYLPNRTVRCAVDDGEWIVVADESHSWGVPADPLPYKPRLGRPFGMSRIARPLMGLQDAATRELLRLEGHMDVYSFPEFWMLGADPSIFRNSDGSTQAAWQVMLGRIKGIPDDEDATNPRADVKKFDAASPEPHLSALNAHAKLFARESSLPDSSLAITDFANPTSADAYDASQYDLIAEAEGATDDWSPGMRRAMIRAMAIKNDISRASDVPTEWQSINTKWRDPRFVSRSAEADAGMKQLAAVPWLAETDVGLELLGITEDQARRAQGQLQRTRGAEVLEQIATGQSAVSPADAANAVKAQADAMGVLIRAGVKPEDAALAVGLDVDFTGAVPTSLRVPQAEAVSLEGE